MIIYQNDLSEMRDLYFCHGEAEAIEWQGRRALKLNGLVIIPDLALSEGHLEVQIGAEGANQKISARSLIRPQRFCSIQTAFPHRRENRWE